MEQEQFKRDHARERKRKQRDTASEESKAKEKESDRLRKKRCIQGECSGHTFSLETHTTLRSLPETLQTTALPSSPSPVRSTYTLHVVTADIYLHISGYSSARGILCACVFLVMPQT